MTREDLMSDRIHLVAERAEKERYRAAAAREGLTLSEWLRAAAEDRLAGTGSGTELDSPEALAAFFEACDLREEGTEPDWEAHRAAIEDSRSGGGPRS